MLLITHDSSKSIISHGLVWTSGGVKAQIGQKWVKLGQEMAESLGDGVCPWCDVFYGEKSKFGVTHCFVSWWGQARSLINNWLTEGFALGKTFTTECDSVCLQGRDKYIYQLSWCNDLFCLSVLGICPTDCWNHRGTTCEAAFTALRAESFGEVLTSAELWAECNLRGSRMKWVQWFVSVQCLLPLTQE